MKIFIQPVKLNIINIKFLIKQAKFIYQLANKVKTKYQSEAKTFF